MVAYQLVQTIYWLALATWFGGALAIVAGVPVIGRVVRESNPILPNVLSVNLDNQHAELLAGEISAGLVRGFFVVQFICAGAVLLMLVAQWLLMELAPPNVTAGLVRSAGFVAAVILGMYHRFLVWPRAWKHRQEYVEHADEPEVANPARERLLQYDRENTRLLLFIAAALSLVIVFSNPIGPRPVPIGG